MLVALRSAPQAAPARVDRRGSGRINGVSIATAGPCEGQGFELDQVSLRQIASLAEGAKGRWTHGNLCADPLGTHLGRWANVRLSGNQVLGDFVFSRVAKNVRPKDLDVDAPTYLMNLAEAEPDVAGVSLAADLEVEEVEGFDGERSVARFTAILRADYVADPAANPAGLFSAKGGRRLRRRGRSRPSLAQLEADKRTEASRLRREVSIRDAHLGQRSAVAPLRLWTAADVLAEKARARAIQRGLARLAASQPRARQGR